MKIIVDVKPENFEQAMLAANKVRPRFISMKVGEAVKSGKFKITKNDDSISVREIKK